MIRVREREGVPRSSGIPRGGSGFASGEGQKEFSADHCEPDLEVFFRHIEVFAHGSEDRPVHARGVLIARERNRDVPVRRDPHLANASHLGPEDYLESGGGRRFRCL